MQLDKNACAILAELLEMASDEFSNHDCNLYELPNTSENRALVERTERWNGEGDWFGLNLSDDGTKIYLMDYFLMGYFAHLFREESTDATSNPG